VPRHPDLHAIGGGVQTPEVLPQLAEVCQRVVLAGREAEHGVRRGHCSGGGPLRRRVPPNTWDEQEDADSEQLEDESGGFPGRHGE
jgi:hypothetical protein